MFIENAKLIKWTKTCYKIILAKILRTVNNSIGKSQYKNMIKNVCKLTTDIG